jgi:hypothetical protein
MALPQQYRTAPMTRTLASALLLALTLSGCTVIAVADTAASAVVGVGGLAVDAAVGTVKLTGKAVGAAAGAVLPGGDE